MRAREGRRMTRRVARLALRENQAALAIGISVDHFQRHAATELRAIYVDGVKVYSAELERYLERQAMTAPAAVRESAGRFRDRMDRGAAEVRGKRGTVSEPPPSATLVRHVRLARHRHRHDRVARDEHVIVHRDPGT
jgi:hypothetical protein